MSRGGDEGRKSERTLCKGKIKCSLIDGDTLKPCVNLNGPHYSCPPAGGWGGGGLGKTYFSRTPPSGDE